MIYFRHATPEDIALLRHWDEQPHVLAAGADDWEWETELHRRPSWRAQLIAMLDDTPIGFAQIINPAEESTQYWGPMPQGYRALDIWIGEAKHLNQGYGTQMMQLLIDRCFAASEVHTILIDPLQSNTKAHRFYERLGFQFKENRRFEEDECRVYTLKKEQLLT